jgi:putrescine transport system permease protein
VVFSFNESRTGHRLGGILHQMVCGAIQQSGSDGCGLGDARVAFVSATIATVLGTIAALVLIRFGRFPGRTLFSGMVYAPLVMPEVITGLSLAAAVCRHQFRPRILDRHHRAHHLLDVLCRGGRPVAAGQF